jgi:hypothetical protein
MFNSTKATDSSPPNQKLEYKSHTSPVADRYHTKYQQAKSHGVSQNSDDSTGLVKVDQKETKKKSL